MSFQEIQKSLQNLKQLPNGFENSYYNVKWINLSNNYHNDYVIFPKNLKPENFDQGDTGLCFFISCLSSIATIPGLIHQLFGKNENWWVNKSFIVYMYYNNKKIEIKVNDSFPFCDGRWIWSQPKNNELFVKILKKAYLIYKLSYDFYNIVTLDNIYEIIYEGGFTKRAMEILINAKTEVIFEKNNNYYYNNNYDEMFKKIKDYKQNKNALITLARTINDGGHAYSVLDAWEFKKGLIKKQVLCIKNPWHCGDYIEEKLNFQSLKESLKNFPELIEFNNRYFDPKKSQKNYLDDLFYNENENINNFSVFVAPLDYLIQNDVYLILAHIPDYNKNFKSVKEEIEIHKKLDKIFHIKQENNVKNVYDSKIDGNFTTTRVLSIGEEDEREIISNCYNNNYYKIKKNGKSYFELEKIFGNFKIVNKSQMFLNDYMDKNYLLINQKTKERKVVTLEDILNGENEKDLTGYDLVCFEHKITIENHGTILKDVIKPKTLKDVKIQNLEYKTIQYDNGYYMGWTLNNQRHGEGKYFFNDGTYKDGKWEYGKFIHGKETFTNGDYYIGDYFNNKFHGEGKYFFNNGTYQDGKWEYGKFIHGKETYSNGDYYIGDYFYDHQFIGFGIYNSFEGTYHGFGKYFFNNGTYKDGKWEYGKFIHGKETHSNGDYYIGDYFNNQRHGYGKYYYINGNYYYGNWKNNKENGYGEEKIYNVIYKGNFLNGKKHGKFDVYINGKYDDEEEYEYGEKQSKCSIF